MKKIIFFAILSLSILSASRVFAGDDEKGVKFFKGTWAELQAEAQKTGRPFFVDFWAPWCGPCRMLNETTFKDENVSAYASKYFLAYKLNVDNGEGKQLGGKFQISSIPAIVFFDASGKEIGREVGYRNGPQFLSALEKYADKAGKAKPMKTKEGAMRFDDYLKIKTETMKPLEKSLVTDGTLDSLKKLALEFGKSKNDYDFENLKTDNKKTLASKEWILDAYYQLGARDFKKYVEIVHPHFEKGELTPEQIHWLCWQCITLSEIPHEPMRWLNQTIRTQPCYELLDTKAALQFKDGKKEDAKNTAEQAEKAAKVEHKNDSSTQILTQVIKGS